MLQCHPKIIEYRAYIVLHTVYLFTELAFKSYNTIESIGRISLKFINRCICKHIHCREINLVLHIKLGTVYLLHCVYYIAYFMIDWCLSNASDHSYLKAMQSITRYLVKHKLQAGFFNFWNSNTSLFAVWVNKFKYRHTK